MATVGLRKVDALRIITRLCQEIDPRVTNVALVRNTKTEFCVRVEKGKKAHMRVSGNLFEITTAIVDYLREGQEEED